MVILILVLVLVRSLILPNLHAIPPAVLVTPVFLIPTHSILQVVNGNAPRAKSVIIAVLAVILNVVARNVVLMVVEAAVEYVILIFVLNVMVGTVSISVVQEKTVWKEVVRVTVPMNVILPIIQRVAVITNI
jgi:hypothetical protein